MNSDQVAYLAFLALALGYIAGRLHANMDAETRRLSSEVSGLKFSVADERRRREHQEAGDGR